MMPLVSAVWAIGATLVMGTAPTIVKGNHFVSAETGQFIMREISTEHGTRRYKLYIPSGYDGSKTFSLVVMLHGCTQDPDDIARGTRFNESAEEKEVFVAYPEQPESANLRKCWNWYEPAHQKRDEGEPALIASITRRVMQDYRVDPQRVYVAGVSAGAAMAVTVALTYPDLYAAVGSHSGLPYGAAATVMEALAAMQGKNSGADVLAAKAKGAMGTRARSMPAIVFQGGSDHVVNATNAVQLVAQLSSIQGVPSSDKAMSTMGEKVESSNGYQYTHSLHGSGETAIELWVVEELGHAWSGGSPAGTFTDAKGPSATTEMLRFFLAHPRPASGPVK
jgi:poly(hydroxyalkanoate) depolymerase family esterase